MNTARVVVVSCCLAVAGCQTTTDPTTGRTVMSTPSFGQLLGLQSGQPAQVASASDAPTGVVEHYRQQLDGKTTDLTLTPTGPGTWMVNASMLLQRPTCVGNVAGHAVEQSPGLIVMSSDDQGNRCGLQVRRGNGTASIGELDCTPDHGAACEFAGDLIRVN